MGKRHSGSTDPRPHKRKDRPEQPSHVSPRKFAHGRLTAKSGPIQARPLELNVTSLDSQERLRQYTQDRTDRFIAIQRAPLEPLRSPKTFRDMEERPHAFARGRPDSGDRRGDRRTGDFRTIASIIQIQRPRSSPLRTSDRQPRSLCLGNMLLGLGDPRAPWGQKTPAITE